MAPVREQGQGPVPRPAMIARYRLPRRLPSRPRERPEPSTAPQTGRPRPHPVSPSLTVAPRFPEARPTKPRAHCRRSRRHPRPGPVRVLRGVLGFLGFRAIRQLRGFRDRRGPRPPRQTSGARGPARLVPRLPRLPRPRGPAGQRDLRAPGVSDQAAPAAQAGREAGLTSRVRDLRAGRPRRGLRDLVRPGRVRPGPAAPGLVPVVPVLARGQATTHSAPPRPAWGRRLRPGRRHPVPLVPLARLARQLIRPVPGSPRVPQAVPALPVGSLVLVRADEDRAGLARPMAVLVRAVLVLAAPGRAR
jgi:hypothetical protein